MLFRRELEAFEPEVVIENGTNLEINYYNGDEHSYLIGFTPELFFKFERYLTSNYCYSFRFTNMTLSEDMIFYYGSEAVPHLQGFIIRIIVERYYAGDNIEKITENYLHNNSDIVSQLPFVVNDQVCTFCQKRLVQRFLDRTFNQAPLGRPFCISCVSQPYYFGTFGQHYEMAYEEICAGNSIISKFIDEQSRNILPYCSESLEFEDLLYLAVLIDAAKKVDSKVVYGVSQTPDITSGLHNDIFMYLINKGIIYYHKNFNSEAFLLENNKLININNFKVNWGINFPTDFNCIPELKGFYQDLSQLELWSSDIKKEWTCLALVECLEFYEFTAHQCNFEIEITVEWSDLIFKMLKHFSTSQCFGLIEGSCRSSHLDEAESKDQLGELSLTKLEEVATDHICNPDISLPNVHRPKQLPRTRISIVLFNHYLRFNDDNAFYEIPKMVDEIEHLKVDH